jgi:hypothetical protein
MNSIHNTERALYDIAKLVAVENRTVRQPNEDSVIARTDDLRKSRLN